MNAGTPSQRPTIRPRQGRDDGDQSTAMTPGVREIVKLETRKIKMQSLAAILPIQSKTCGYPSCDYSNNGGGPAKTIKSEKSKGA